MDRSVIDERTRAIALALTRGIGWKLIQRLLTRFGSLERALSASTEELRTVKGIGSQIAQRIQSINTARLAADLERFEADHIHAAMWRDSAYPARFTSLEPSDDRPLTLFWKGTLSLDVQTIAIVGTRQPKPESLKTAEELAEELAQRGWTVVSGLARGIDSAAHRGALQGGGCTLAVLGSGINCVYPRENIPLASQIVANGALISELHPDTSPSPNALVRRNRLITGLSRAVIVIEAGEGSGALYAARCAHVQKRPVFVLNNSAGNEDLLRRFAQPLPPSIDSLIEQIETFEQAIIATANDKDRSAGTPPVDGSTQLMLL